VVNFTEFEENLIVKPLGALAFRVIVSVPLAAAGSGPMFKLG